jgi:hypothetical protein
MWNGSEQQVLDTKRRRRGHLLRKTEKNCARLEISPWKLLVWPAQQTSVSTSSSRTASKLFHSHAHTTTVVHKLYNTDHKARVNFVKLYHHVAYDAEIFPTFTLFSDKACFHLRGHVKSQNIRFTRYSTKCHYTMLRLVCNVLWGQLWLLGHFTP